MYKTDIIIFELATKHLILFIQEYYQKTENFFVNTFSKLSKIANQQFPHQSPPTTSKEPPALSTDSQTNNPQSSTRISFQDNPYTFEERHALEPVIRQASISEPQYEPVYNINPLSNKILIEQRHQSQNQNTLEINR